MILMDDDDDDDDDDQRWPTMNDRRPWSSPQPRAAPRHQHGRHRWPPRDSDPIAMVFRILWWCHGDFNRVLMVILWWLYGDMMGYNYSDIQLIHPSSLDRNICFHWYVFELSLHKAPRWMVHLFDFSSFLETLVCTYPSPRTARRCVFSITLNQQHLKWLCLKIIEHVAALNPFDNV